MAPHIPSRRPRRGRWLRPCLLRLEERVVPALTLPGITGIAIDTSGDVFLSYNSSTGSQQQSVAEVPAEGRTFELFTTTGSSATPGALAEVGSSASDLPVSGASDILELQPDGALYDINPTLSLSSQDTTPIADLSNAPTDASGVFDVQTGAGANLTGQVSLSGATFGDFGVYQNALVVSAVSNGWDLVARVTYSSSTWSATVLAASPIGSGTATPQGVAVDSQGTVLTTMPYVPAGSTTSIDVPVGFSLYYDTGSTPTPTIPTLGLMSVPDIDSTGIAVDSQDNFLLVTTTSSLYGGGPGVVHINDALTAFLADPVSDTETDPTGIAYQDVDGTNYLAYTDASSDSYTVAGELSLFSGQVTPAQLRSAYGINQITFAGPDGTTVAGTGAGQTIAIVEEGVDPTLEADLTTFDNYFGIAAPPSFQIVDQDGSTTENLSIVGEASLDVEWAHAIAPGASIIVYNAAYDPNNATTSLENLLTAMNQASQIKGVSVVTLSYGISEASLEEMGLSETSFDADFTTPGVTFLAAAGDSGIYGDGGREVTADYPAASPDVIAVGGTSLTIDAAGDYPGTGESGEVAWGSGTASGSDGGGGGGLSAVEPEPTWQTSVVSSLLDSSGTRALPDVSMDSGAAQPYDVFTSTLSGSSVSSSAVGWLGDAGTSAASPIWAGLIAIADQGRALAGGTSLTGYDQTLPALYSLPSSDFHDILYGNNGDAAGPGYDLATGLGTPVANLLVPALADYQLTTQLTVTSEPPASVAANSPFGLTVQVDNSQGDAVNGGTVSIGLADDPGGATLGGTLTANIVDGVATFSGLTLSEPGTDYILTISDGSATVQTSAITVTGTGTTGGGSTTTQVSVSSTPEAPVFGEAVTLQATISLVGSGDVPTGTATFEEASTVLGTVSLSDGVARLTTTPSAAGTEAITVSYSGDDAPGTGDLSLTIAPAAATLTLSGLDVTYDGAPQAATVTTDPSGLSGVTVTYSEDGVPIAAPVLPGTYTVTATLDNPDYTATPVTSTLIIGQPTSTPTPSPTPTPAPTPTTIIGEQPVFRRKLNKHGKPTGKEILVGFTLDFSAPLATAAASNPANYELGNVTTRKVKKVVERVLHPVSGFAVSYTPTSDAVTITLAGSQTFPTGGEITVLPGVTDGSGGELVGTTVFTIRKGGKSIGPS